MAQNQNEMKILYMPQFIVHEHQARSHHFDFRLEINGVLKSWAIPKGPSMKAKEKHLAIEVADHPLSYAQYEGIIPKGNYGAGPVVIWDRGTFEPLGNKNVSEQFNAGHLTILLRGRKLEGVFYLFKMEGRNKQWLLTKMEDHHANPHWKMESELTPSHLKKLKEQIPPCHIGSF